MTSRKFCYWVVTKHILPQKQRLPYPSVKVEKAHCVCLMIAIPCTYFPQLCKGASKVCIMKIPETMKFQEHLSRQVQGTYAGLTMSLEWLKLYPSDTTHWSFCQVFFFFKSEHFLWFLLSTATQVQGRADWCRCCVRASRANFTDSLYLITQQLQWDIRGQRHFWGRWILLDWRKR